MSRYGSFPEDARLADTGEMTAEVVVESRPSADAVFPSEDVWTELATVFMRKRTVGGQERFEAAQTSAPVDTIWTFWYRPDMDPDEVEVAKLRRLQFKARQYDVIAAAAIGRMRQQIELYTLSRIG
jgi:head-tail adaptor